MDNYEKLKQISLARLRDAAAAIFSATPAGQAYNNVKRTISSPQFQQFAQPRTSVRTNTAPIQWRPVIQQHVIPRVSTALRQSNPGINVLQHLPWDNPVSPFLKGDFAESRNALTRANKRANERFKNDPLSVAMDFGPTGFTGTINKATKPLINAAGQQVTKALSGRQKHALNKLDDLMHYGQELKQFGYSDKAIDKLNVHQGREILDRIHNNGGIPPKPHTGVPDFMDGIRNEPTDVKQKVNIIDKYLRTPDRVLKKIGLEHESNYLRRQYDKYVAELPIEIEKITAWSKRVSPDANRRIFQYLDGKPVRLADNEKQVAGEIQSYLKEWAEKLGLPEDKRVTNYITHIFEQDLIQKEFDDDLAKLLTEEVAGSVYDPFVTKRLGRQGYIEDTWRALDAYVKRATRKYNLDPALNSLKKASENMELSQHKYVKEHLDRVNMRPTEADNLIDNTIKQVVGYKFGQRPTANITRKARRMIYRGTLGLNPGTALKNLSQGANTYARLGEKYTIIGYIKTLKNLLTNSDELERVGVLQNGYIQDQTLNATQKFWERTDKVLFAMFETAEKINRGAAYFGAKAKGKGQGMSEKDAIEYAKKIVRDTQFTFGSIDTPPVLQSDIGKTLLQFQSYSLKQGEFLAEMVKNKDVAGMVRYIAATYLFIHSVGKLMGMEQKDIIPSIRFGVPPVLQLPYEIGKAAVNAPDKWGNEFTGVEKAKNIGKALVPLIPAGTQIKKSIGGYNTTNKGYSETAAGRVRYPVSQDTGNKIRGTLFGEYNLPEARAYRDSDGTVLGEEQSKEFKVAPDKHKFYQDVMDKRAQDNLNAEIRERLKNSTKTYLDEDNAFFVKKRNGDIERIEKSVQLARPMHTGNVEIDTRRLEEYRTSLTDRMNEVYTLAKAGAITKDKAIQETNRLLSVYNGVRAVLAGKYVKPKTLEDFAKDKLRAEVEADAKQIYTLLEDGKITNTQAEKMLRELEGKLESMKVSARTRKARKPKKITITKGKKITVPKVELVKPTTKQAERAFKPYKVADINPYD